MCINICENLKGLQPTILCHSVMSLLGTQDSPGTSADALVPSKTATKKFGNVLAMTKQESGQHACTKTGLRQRVLYSMFKSQVPLEVHFVSTTM